MGAAQTPTSHRPDAGETSMDKRLHLLETFTARGSDGQTYVIHGYEHLVQLDTLQDVLGQWEPTGLAEYKAADGRPVHVAADGKGVAVGACSALKRAYRDYLT
eukprot:gene54744-75018_t